MEASNAAAPGAQQPQQRQPQPPPRRGGRRAVALVVGLVLLVAAVGAAIAISSSGGSDAPAPAPAPAPPGPPPQDLPTWGCGLLGPLPGISEDGSASPETQRLIDGIRKSSTLGKVSYWNWDLAPTTVEKKPQLLTKDFVFMPEQWGSTTVNATFVRPAGKAGFLDGDGRVSPATMAEIFLGANEPDIIGSCMGPLFGKCTQPCDQDAIARNDCPIAELSGGPVQANKDGQCDCSSKSHPTGDGFWPFEGCAAVQPMPTMWKEPACVDAVLAAWKKTAAIAVSKGYKYLSTPLVAENMDYAENFIAKACEECQDASCGCPQFVGFHFYANDCRPTALKGYEIFKERLAAVAKMMERFPFVQGAIINEVGMLNCVGTAEHPICVPDSGEYPAKNQSDHACPSTDELPNGLGTFVEQLLDMAAAAKTKDGRSVVKAFTWFNQNMEGGTYDLRLFDEEGKLNKVGEAYIRGCSRWGDAQRAASPDAAAAAATVVVV